MRQRLAFAAALTTVCALSVVVLGLTPGPVAAQNLDDVEMTDRDFGRMLRHPNAYRDELGAPRSFRADSGGSRYTYTFYDHPKPSFQFFQQGQTYKWSWDLFPGGERRIYGNPRPRGYYGPTYSTYNTYNTYITQNNYYLSPGYRGW